MAYTLVLMDDTRDWLTTHRAGIHAALLQKPDVVLEVVDHHGRGYCHQMRLIWELLRGHPTDHVLFWEADFRPASLIDVAAMVQLLDEHQYLAQVALLRQPWFHNEVEHGGLIEALEAQGQVFTDHDGFIEHRAFWTGNPSVFRRGLVDIYDWPDVEWSESQFGSALRSSGHSFAILGTDRVPHVEHRGERTEASHGY